MGNMSVGRQGGGVAGPNSNNNNTNSSVSKFLSHSVQDVLSGLGIKAGDIAKISSQKGQHTSQGKVFQEMQFLPISNANAAAIDALGLKGVEMAIVVSAEEELSYIKKRFEEIKNTLIDKATAKKLLNLLGLDAELDSLIFTDKDGGLVIIQSSMEEIEKSIEEENR